MVACSNIAAVAATNQEQDGFFIVRFLGGNGVVMAFVDVNDSPPLSGRRVGANALICLWTDNFNKGKETFKDL